MASMKIDLLSPESFAAGHPLAQYRWLRENEPVHLARGAERPGLLGGDALQGRLGRRPQLPDLLVRADDHDQDPPAEAAQGFGGYKMMLMMDPPQHTAFRKLIRSEFTVPVSARAHAAHARSWRSRSSTR